MGTFVSKPARSPVGREAVTACFSALADIIASCPRLAANAKFLLIPGVHIQNSTYTFRLYLMKSPTCRSYSQVRMTLEPTTPCPVGPYQKSSPKILGKKSHISLLGAILAECDFSLKKSFCSERTCCAKCRGM